jgi:hypothetical protein
MKQIICLLLLAPLLSFAQKPQWAADADRRLSYPREQYLTGFAVNVGRNTASFMDALKASAKSELVEGIRVSVQSAKQVSTSEAHGVLSEEYLSTATTFAEADINGLKVEHYYDAATQTGYAFAYAVKSEVRGYYKASIAFTVQKIEGAIGSAAQLESSGSKGRAKKMYEEVQPLFGELSFAQSLLIAIGSDEESLQAEKSLALKSALASATARMQSAITVCVQSDEANFGQRVRLLEPKLKAALSQRGCSYTSNPDKADWLLTISAATRQGREVEGIYFSFLDATVSLVERSTGKEIYSNNFTDLKGGGLDYETAGRKAYDSSLQQIADAITSSLEK